MIDWSDIKYFREDEFRPPGYQGDLNMGIGFLLKLDNMRAQVRSPFIIHRNGGYAVTGHSEHSLHYMGQAADLHITEASSAKPRDLIEQALLAYKWLFLSIGIYPCWNKPGLHLDDRTAVGRDKVTWFKDHEDQYHFYPYDEFYRCVRDLTRYLEERRPEKRPRQTSLFN